VRAGRGGAGSWRGDGWPGGRRRIVSFCAGAGWRASRRAKSWPRSTGNGVPNYGYDRITQNSYDAAGQLLTIVHGLNSPAPIIYATYSYGPDGEKLTVKDANSNLTTYAYDGFLRLTQTEFPSFATPGSSDPNDVETYGYDANGNRLSLTKRDGRTIAYAYDRLNREIQAIYPSASAALDVATSYDPAGRPCFEAYSQSAVTPSSGPCPTSPPSGVSSVSYVYDSGGRLIGETTGGLAIGFGLDAAGNRTRVTWPDGFWAGYVYDAMNRVTAVNENGATSGVGVLASYAYDSLGRRTGITRGNGTSTSFGYDGSDRMSSLAHSIPSNNTAYGLSLGFVYNPASQLITKTWSNQAYSWLNHPAGAPVNSTYDGLNRDASIATTAPSCPTTTLAANAGYDCDGNQMVDKAGVRHFAYDIENRLVGVTGQPTTAALAYDPLGRLQSYQTATSGTTTATRFLYDGSRLVAEYDGSGNLLSRYVHGPGVDEPLVWYQAGAGMTWGAPTTWGSPTTWGGPARYWLHTDRQGSVIALSNAAGTVTQTFAYGPWGEPQNPAWGGSRFAYTGQIQLPEVQLYHYKARAYDPSCGCFLQTDPVGYTADNDLYAYVGEDPLNRSDPTGETPAGALGVLEASVPLELEEDAATGGATPATAVVVGGTVVVVAVVAAWVYFQPADQHNGPTVHNANGPDTLSVRPETS
jgi:RHS repeat-associated protein